MIGYGEKVNIWSYNWIPNQCAFKVLTQKPLETRVVGVKDLINGENSCQNNYIIDNIFLLIDK